MYKSIIICILGLMCFSCSKDDGVSLVENPSGTPPPYTRHWTGMLSSFGPIGAATTLDGHDKFLLINKEGTKYMISENATLDGPYHIDELGETPCPLNNIGAAAYIEGSSTTGTIMFFDEPGINLTYYYINTRKWGQVEKVSEWGGGEFPFNLNGISAALNFGVEADPALPDYYTNIRAFFEANSDRYCLFRNKQYDAFDSPQNMNNFVLNNDYMLEGVGAGIGFTLGSQRFWLLFNEAGNSYTIAVDDWSDYYLGPYYF